MRESVLRDLASQAAMDPDFLRHADAWRAELEALGLPVSQLDGEQVLRLLWARFNPTSADGTRRAPLPSTATTSPLRRCGWSRTSGGRPPR